MVKQFTNILIFTIALSLSANRSLAQTSIELTAEEQGWLSNHKNIRVSSTYNFAPWEVTINGKASGYSIEYIQLIAGKLGLNLEFVQDNWSTLLDKARAQEIDMMLSMSIFPKERAEFLNFTKYYKVSHRAIVTKVDKVNINRIEDLDGMTVAMVKGDTKISHLKQFELEIRIIEEKDYESTLRSVAFGRADATLIDLPVANYLIRDLVLTNLHVAAEMERQSIEKSGLRIAIRKDWPELIPIVEKAMSGLTHEELAVLDNRWLAPVTSSLEQQKFQNELYKLLTPKNIVLFALILVILIIGTFFLFKTLDRSKKNPLAFDFSSNRGKKVVLFLNSLLILVVFISAWLALLNIKNKIKEDIPETLQAVLQTTMESLNLWARDRKNELNIIAADPRLVELVQKQLANYANGSDLVTSNEVVRLRNLFDTYDQRADRLGFFVISPDGASIASMRDSNIGSQNLIHLKEPTIFERVLGGETVMILPIALDVPIAASANITGINLPPTMFFASPIKDANGLVIAVLAERYDPHGDFSRINKLGRIGQTGDTYSFNRQAKLLTESRFVEQLVAAQLIDENEQSILSIDLRDPTASELPLTLMAASAINGETNYNVDGYPDYRGVPVFGAWTWDELLGIGITTEIEVEEAMETYTNARLAILITLGITVLTSVIFSLLILILGSRTNKAQREAHNLLEVRVSDRTQKLSLARDEAENALEKLKLMQVQLIQSEKMASLGVLTAGIAHEINNPINFISSGAHSLDKDFKDLLHVLNTLKSFPKDGETLKESAEIIRKLEEEYAFEDIIQFIPQTIEDIKEGVNRTAKIIKGLLLYSRSNTSEQQMADIQEDIEASLVLLRDRYKDHIEIIKHYDLSIGKIKCFHGQLSQVFTNLIDNAIDAIEDKGAITITTALKNKQVQISIRDTGEGIPDDNLSKIFDPFFTTKEVGKGTGLGLSICQGIINNHGGKIQVKSKLKKGSEFIITLPVE